MFACAFLGGWRVRYLDCEIEGGGTKLSDTFDERKEKYTSSLTHPSPVLLSLFHLVSCRIINWLTLRLTETMTETSRAVVWSVKCHLQGRQTSCCSGLDSARGRHLGLGNVSMVTQRLATARYDTEQEVMWRSTCEWMGCGWLMSDRGRQGGGRVRRGEA